jgi:hypothetical protein
MQIVAETKLIDLVKFLKRAYNLTLHIMNTSIDFQNEMIGGKDLYSRAKINKKKEVIFLINDSTEVDNLIQFIYHTMGILVEIRNINGVKLSNKTTIKDGSNIISASEEIDSVKNNIDTAVEILKLKSYSDLDWFFRVLEKCIYKAKTIDDKWLVIKALILAAEKNEYFPIEHGLLIIQRCFNDDNQIKAVYSQMSNSHSNNVSLMASKLSGWID